MTTTYAIQFEESEPQRIQKLLDFVQSLDFVRSVKAFSDEDAVVNMPISAPVEGYLTIDDIKILHPNQWVLIAYTRKKETDILGGKVILHEANKRDLALKGRDLIRLYPDVNHFYTGEFTKRTRIGLLKKVVQ